VRYLLHLFGYPVPDSEFIQQIINGETPRLGDEQEQTDSDFFDRAYADGTEGELFEIDDAWFMFDTFDSPGREARIGANGVTGRWELRDWNNSTAATPSDESPIFFHGNWPVRFPEERYDFASLSSFIKVAVNNNANVTDAQDAVYREQMERMLDVDRAAIYAAVRGYAGDWDNFTSDRGKNGYFYRRPTDGRFEFHHWDSDLAFQSDRTGLSGSSKRCSTT
jgi:CotH kinase protein